MSVFTFLTDMAKSYWDYCCPVIIIIIIVIMYFY